MNTINNIKALIFDLDGTLLSSKKTIAPKTLDILLSLKEKGMRIIIATGRPPLSGMQKLGRLNLATPMVCANGACIYDPLKKVPIKEKRLETSSVERLLKIAHDKKKNALVYTLAHTYVSKNLIDTYLEISDVKDSVEVMKTVLPLEDYKLGEELVYKCIINADNIGYDIDFMNYLEKNCNNLSQPLFFTFAHPDFLEIVDKSINKYISLSNLLKNLNIDEKEVVAFGDGVNDLEMLEKFPYSVAMGNASDEVKKAATFTTLSNDDEGIYDFLKRNITI